MGKIIDLHDDRYEKELRDLPSEYSISVLRTSTKSDSTGVLFEEFEWDVEGDMMDTVAGNALLYNHLLTIIMSIVEANPELADDLKTAIYDELGGPDDSDFNK